MTANTKISFERLGRSLLIHINTDDVQYICREVEKNIAPVAHLFKDIPVFIQLNCKISQKNFFSTAKDFFTDMFGNEVFFISGDHKVSDNMRNDAVIYAGLNEIAHETYETEWIFRNIRSGQHIEYNGHLVIVGDVNSGAFVKASGNVCITGFLRGTVHAGYKNNHNAVIIAARFIPAQIRIGKYVGRAPDEELFASYTPEVAYISDDRIVIEQYKEVLLNKDF